VGPYEVHSLTDAAGAVPVLVTQVFPTVGEAEWALYRRLYPGAFTDSAQWYVRIGCNVIRGQGRAIVVDTGIGPSNLAFAKRLGLGGALPERLLQAGIGLEEVDTVLLTHLHADHVGWNVVHRGTSQPRAFFPNARYLVHASDWQWAQHRLTSRPDEAQYVVENLLPLAEMGLLHTFAGTHEVASGITAFETPGHTPGHVSVRVEVEGHAEALVLLGDVAAHPLQITTPDHPYARDVDFERARETRRTLIKQIQGEGMAVSACHFPIPGFGHLRKRDGRLVWEAVH
jgi:glyoxylase-like metal-dependent hydrolase (beta-lactamase superfamily II)